MTDKAAEEMAQRAIDFRRNNQGNVIGVMVSFAASEVEKAVGEIVLNPNELTKLAVAQEREEICKLVCHFCAWPGEWSAAEKRENGWLHLYGERKQSVTSCAAAAIHERAKGGS